MPQFIRPGNSYASASWGMSSACRRMVRKNKLRRLGIAGQRR